MGSLAHVSWLLTLSGAELRSRLINLGWPEGDAEQLVECHRAGCPECTETLVEVLT